MLDARDWPSGHVEYPVRCIELRLLFFHCPVAKGCAAGYFFAFNLLVSTYYLRSKPEFW